MNLQFFKTLFLHGRQVLVLGFYSSQAPAHGFGIYPEIQNDMEENLLRKFIQGRRTSQTASGV